MDKMTLPPTWNELISDPQWNTLDAQSKEQVKTSWMLDLHKAQKTGLIDGTPDDLFNLAKSTGVIDEDVSHPFTGEKTITDAIYGLGQLTRKAGAGVNLAAGAFVAGAPDSIISPETKDKYYTDMVEQPLKDAQYLHENVSQSTSGRIAEAVGSMGGQLALMSPMGAVGESEVAASGVIEALANALMRGATSAAPIALGAMAERGADDSKTKVQRTVGAINEAIKTSAQMSLPMSTSGNLLAKAIEDKGLGYVLQRAGAAIERGVEGGVIGASQAKAERMSNGEKLTDNDYLQLAIDSGMGATLASVLGHSPDINKSGEITTAKKLEEQQNSRDEDIFRLKDELNSFKPSTERPSGKQVFNNADEMIHDDSSVDAQLIADSQQSIDETNSVLKKNRMSEQERLAQEEKKEDEENSRDLELGKGLVMPPPGEVKTDFDPESEMAKAVRMDDIKTYKEDLDNWSNELKAQKTKHKEYVDLIDRLVSNGIDPFGRTGKVILDHIDAEKAKLDEIESRKPVSPSEIKSELPKQKPQSVAEDTELPTQSSVSAESPEAPEAPEAKVVRIDDSKGLEEAQIEHANQVGQKELSGINSEESDGNVEAVKKGGHLAPPENGDLANYKAAVNDVREKRGDDPLEEQGSREWGVSWDNAKKTIKNDPEAARRLVKRTNSASAPKVNDFDLAILLHHRMDISNRINEVSEMISNPNTLPEDRVDMHLEEARLHDYEAEAEKAVLKSGKGLGRALNFLKAVTKKDYSLESMRRRLISCNDGEALSKEQLSKLDSQSKEIERLNAELDKAIEAKDEAEYVSNIEPFIKSVKKESTNEIENTPNKKEKKSKLLEFTESAASAARKRLKEKLGRTSAMVDPTILADVAIIGADYLANGVIEFREWSSKIVSEIGEHIRPHLNDIYTKSKVKLDELSRNSDELLKKNSILNRLRRGMASQKIEDGQAISRAVGSLSRLHIKSGIDDVHKLIDAVHEDLKEHLPDLTKHEVTDALSGYAKRETPKNDPLSVRLRKMKSDAMDLSRKLDNQFENKQEQKRIEREKSRLEKAISDIERQIEEQYFPKKNRNRKGVTQNQEIKVLVSKLEDAKSRARQSELDLRRKKQGSYRDFIDRLQSLSRGNKLLSVVILPKLLAAAVYRGPLEYGSRLLAQPIRVISPSLYKKALPELGANMKIEVQSQLKFITKLAQVWEKIKTGKSDISTFEKTQKSSDLELLGFIGNVHGGAKEPAKQVAFNRAEAYEFERAAQEGRNANDPLVIAELESAASEQANRHIFMNENAFSKFIIKDVILNLKKSNEIGMYELANVLQFLMPIVKVGSNIAVHTARLNPLVSGIETIARLSIAKSRGELKNGLSGLSKADAEIIARVIKTGELGLILSAYAWMYPDNFGGTYDEKGKRAFGLKANEFRIFGVNLPHYLGDIPEIKHLNIVASARRLYDKNVKKDPNDKMTAITNSLAFALLAPVKNFPFVDAWVRLMSNTKSAGMKAADYVRDAFIPTAFPSTMELIEEYKGERKPNPTTPWEELKMSIPFLRGTISKEK